MSTRTGTGKASTIVELRNAGHQVIVVLKYQQNQDMPRSDTLVDYVGACVEIAKRIGGGVGLCFGNEPNWASFDAAGNLTNEWIPPEDAAAIVNQAAVAIVGRPNDARFMFDLWVTPIAPWSPVDVPGDTIGPGIENSPWGRYCARFYAELKQKEIFKGALIHAYADCGKDGTANNGRFEPIYERA